MLEQLRYEAFSTFVITVNSLTKHLIKTCQNLLTWTWAGPNICWHIFWGQQSFFSCVLIKVIFGICCNKGLHEVIKWWKKELEWNNFYLEKSLYISWGGVMFLSKNSDSFYWFLSLWMYIIWRIDSILKMISCVIRF